MSKITFLLFLSISFLFSDEVSVFGAGDLDDSSPYGLTSSEKKIIENKKEINRLAKKDLKSKKSIDNLQNQIEVLKDLVVTLGKQNNNHKLKIANLIDDLRQNHLVTEIGYQKLQENMNKTNSQAKKEDVETKKSLNEKIKDSFAQVNSALKKQNRRLLNIEQGVDVDFKKFQNKLNKTNTALEKVNKRYVTQKQLDFIVKEFNKFKETVIGEFEKLSKEDDNYYNFSKHTNVEIFKQGKKNIQLGKHQEAIKFFSYLITKHYRPATDNFYIGESYYFIGNYEQAIKHYKKSVSIYDKSKFMPTLLLHSGESLEKIHDVKQAKSFYSVLISQYGDIAEGIKAKKLLDRLNK